MLNRNGLLLVALLVQGGCATQPDNPHNLCDIFEQKRSWYSAAHASANRWGGPIHVPMAMMYQESAFRDDAKPPIRWLLGFIPLGRASSAYGYPQALDTTWAHYQREVGGLFKSRDDFGDAIDFMFWYMDKSYRINGVSKWDAHAQYLNYHEGHGGYARATYKDKPWLIKAARRVDTRAKVYAAQYNGCKHHLDRGWLMRLIF